MWVIVEFFRAMDHVNRKCHFHSFSDKDMTVLNISAAFSVNSVLEQRHKFTSSKLESVIGTSVTEDIIEAPLSGLVQRTAYSQSFHAIFHPKMKMINDKLSIFINIK